MSKKETLRHQRIIAQDFLERALHFLNFPRKLWECDIKECRKELYQDIKGQKHKKKSKKMLTQLLRARKILQNLHKNICYHTKQESLGKNTPSN